MPNINHLSAFFIVTLGLVPRAFNGESAVEVLGISRLLANDEPRVTFGEWV